MVMGYILPERPENAQELPFYERRRYWQAMARAVRLVRPGIVEIPQFLDMRTRVVGLVMGIGWCLMLLYAFHSTYGSVQAGFEEIADDYDYVFNFEERIRTQYQQRIDRGTNEGRTEDEYVQDFHNNRVHQNRFLRKAPIWIGLLGTPLILLGIAAFWPRRCPIRFDRKHEIAYTWHKGTLWIADIGALLGGLNAAPVSGMEGNPLFKDDIASGPLALEMRSAANPHTKKRFLAGISPVAHWLQNRDLHLFIQAFMIHHPRDPEGKPYEWKGDWLEKLHLGRPMLFDILRFFSSRSLIRERFDEEKTEAALMEYLTTPSTRDRGKRIR